jgi:hypothetical protein
VSLAASPTERSLAAQLALRAAIAALEQADLEIAALIAARVGNASILRRWQERNAQALTVARNAA